MLVHNAEVAAIFNRLADLLEIQGENPFRVRAYRIAAQTMNSLPRPVTDLVAQGEDLDQLPGIGKDLAGKIQEIVRTGRLQKLDEVARKVPLGLAELLELEGLGPKRVRLLYEQLGIRNRQQLAAAARASRVRALPGFGPKTEQRILQQIQQHERTEQRFRLFEVTELAESLVAYLRKTPGVGEVVTAGSYRRRKETVGDLDVLVTCQSGKTVVERFVAYDEVQRVLSKGATRSSVRLRSGLQVDLRVVKAASFGAALHYFTGSKSHNIAIRKLAVQRGLKINEYGVYRGARRIAGRTEASVYRQVRLPYIEPELRENRGELEAARQGGLPHLITLADIRGDLHCHTKASDGHHTIEQMALAAKQRGYDYLAITDHTKNLAMARGQDERRLAQQIKEIERVNQSLRGIRILKSAEVDILPDGSLDLDDAILSELDFTVCSIHSQFKLPREPQTERLIRAMDNPHFNILAHPTGRLLMVREPYDIDLERVMKAALERGCYLEQNAHPERLDLSDVHCRLAKEMGLKLAISTDAHSVTDFELIHFGLDQGRRGWLEADDVLNSQPWSQLQKLLRR